MSTNIVPMREGLSSEANPQRQMVTRLDSPLNMMITSEYMNKENLITNRMDKLFFRWGSPIGIDKEKTGENKLKVTELISTGKNAWKESTEEFNANNRLIAKQKPPLVLESYSCVVLAEGRFPNAFKDKKRPEWPKQRQGRPPSPSNEGPEMPLASEPGKLILIGSGDIFHDQLIGALEDTSKLLTNIVDYLVGSHDIMAIRNKEMISRVIEQSKLKEKYVAWWKIFVIGGFSIILVIGGIGYYVIRIRSRKKGKVAVPAARAVTHGMGMPESEDNKTEKLSNE